jgi:hypothetical protein
MAQFFFILIDNLFFFFINLFENFELYLNFIYWFNFNIIFSPVQQRFSYNKIGLCEILNLLITNMFVTDKKILILILKNLKIIF